MRKLAVLALLALAACGADGAPERPGVEPGITISGTLEVGVSGS
ncbi:argininosuccinate lyase [Actibacterium atlanticum]|nr:argininosuccinate lyase [Actibacterium atlanticum]